MQFFHYVVVAAVKGGWAEPSREAGQSHQGWHGMVAAVKGGWAELKSMYLNLIPWHILDQSISLQAATPVHSIRMCDRAQL